MRVFLSFFACLICISRLLTQTPTPDQALQITLPDGPKPWTHLRLNNAPETFQFAIVTDRTGGHRPGVFQYGVDKLNLLQPEFVMSVGDLIEGYTTDTVELLRQWEEFDGFVQQLDMPFFYVPGNHDITNPVMEEVWHKRYGPTHYYFIYRDVLFLCLNSEDHIRGAGRGTMGDEQYEWVKRVLAAHTEVKWTLLFMHQPLWVQDAETLRWGDVEKLLAEREHTVFVGHRHHYVKYERNNGKYFMLATTGGGSRLRGPQMGEFDHVVWVTMTEQGPIIANLQLEGVWDEDVVTEEGYNFISGIGEDLPIRPEVLFAKPSTFERGEIQIKLQNNRDIPMHISMDDRFDWDFTATLSMDTLTIAPNSVAFARMDLARRPDRKAEAAGGVPLDIQLSYRAEGMPTAEVPLSYRIGPVEPHLLASMDKRVKINGDLSEWEELPYRIGGDDNEGPSGRFQAAVSDRFLYLAARVKDEDILSDTATAPWRQDFVGFAIQPDAMEISALDQGEGWYRKAIAMYISPDTKNGKVKPTYAERYPEGTLEWACKPVPEGYQLEVAIPLSMIVDRQGPNWSSVRINMAVQDLDAGDTAPRIEYWQPDWRGEHNVLGSGMFFRNELPQGFTPESPNR